MIVRICIDLVQNYEDMYSNIWLHINKDLLWNCKSSEMNMKNTVVSFQQHFQFIQIDVLFQFMNICVYEEIPNTHSSVLM